MNLDEIKDGEVLGILKPHRNLALVEVPVISGKLQLQVLWKSGTFLPLYERKINTEYCVDSFVTPVLLKLVLIEDED